MSIISTMQSMHCKISGTGTIALICIHGWGCEGGQFAGLARALDPDFRVYRPDLPGHGATPLDLSRRALTPTPVGLPISLRAADSRILSCVDIAWVECFRS